LNANQYTEGGVGVTHAHQGIEAFQLKKTGKKLDGTVGSHQNTNGEKLDSIWTGQVSGSVVFPQKIDQEELDAAKVGPKGEAVLAQELLAGT
jgi:DMSO/TMAO reductase YedYZ molybdopterin-dependent catalytic subunit